MIQVLGLMPWLSMRQPQPSETTALLRQLVGGDVGGLDPLVRVQDRLSRTGDVPLSVRQCVRIARRLQQFPEHADLRTLVEEACLSRFLPPLAKDSLQEVLSQVTYLLFRNVRSILNWDYCLIICTGYNMAIETNHM